ncbi:MAG TPA: hypothetical protein PK453_09455 [Leptospiraceae bacterium]|nr:hypothetical protein [Leptospiraceae bacterium]HNF13884.1 hypothetical protein [Leptospiraceae bacterium]HNF22872.1 hypothetical protein [Leptospiraceae bacterium]HNH06966.1 hypothetical protein [Leptospiraceae bacterium]HNI95067.1 hypothetical protein [Leptospiraceae bacterium]
MRDYSRNSALASDRWGKTSGNVFINTSSLNGIGVNTDGLGITSAANTDLTQISFMITLLADSQASGMTMTGSETGACSRFIFLNTASYGNSESGANQLSMGGTPIDYSCFTGKFLLESTANSCNSTNGNSAGYSNSSPCTAGGSSDFTEQSFSIGASDMIGQTK